MTTRARIALTALIASFPGLSAAAQLLVLNKGDATLAFVDPASGKTSATVPTGEGPHEVAVSSDGKLAFVSNYGAQSPGNRAPLHSLRSPATITLPIDLKMLGVARTIETGDGPDGMAWVR